MDASLALVAEASEVAVAVARRDAGTPDAPTPPAALRPLLRFNRRLPARALATVRDALDADEAFRSRVAAEVDEASAERSTWLFLTRPDGWEEEFALLVATESEVQARQDADRDEQAAVRRVEQLQQALERARLEVDRQGREAADALAAAEGERDLRRQAERQLAAAQQALADTESARRTAVQQLSEARSLAEARLEQLRGAEVRAAELEQQLDRARTELAAPGVEVAEVAGPGVSADVVRAVHAAAAVAAELGRALDEAASSLGPAAPSDGAPAPASAGVAGPGAGPSGAPVRRRRPVRLLRGAMDGTPQATDQILRTPGVVVVVDGYNVSMQGWPTLGTTAQRDRLVALLSDVRSRSGADVHVVFDGDDDGRRPAVSTPLPVRVHFSRAEVEADDVVLDFVDRLPVDRPVAVVSSDRRVRDGARERGANVIGSGDLLAWGRR